MAIANSLANISSTFAIKSSFTAGTGTYSITNPGRTFRILQVYGTGTSGSTITVRKNSGAGATIAVCSVLNAAGGGSDTLQDQPAVMTLANENMLTTDNLHITVAGQPATEITILCVATGGGQALVTTDLP